MQACFYKKIAVSVLTALLITAQASGYAARADETNADSIPVSLYSNNSGEKSYFDYADEHADVPYANDNISRSGTEYSTESGSGAIAGSYEGKEALCWESGTGSVTYTVEIPADALYTIWLSYRHLNSNSTKIFLGIEIDGSYPFAGMDNLSFPVFWKNDGDTFRKDSNGNELTPQQLQMDGFYEKSAYDDTGLAIAPYEVFFSAGTHSITLVALDVPFILEKIILKAPENTAKYSELSLSYPVPSDSKDSPPVYVQGEAASKKSARSFAPLNDSAESGLTPSDPGRSLLNYTGGTVWKAPGDMLEWDFFVEEAGYYKLAFKYKQNMVVNGESYRWLKIDGKTPFQEAQCVAFSYNAKWKTLPYADDGGTPYMIWLDAGKHSLSLEVTLGGMVDYYRKLSAIVSSLSDRYLMITKITGQVPDINLDYELFNQIPGLTEALQSEQKALLELARDMLSKNNKQGGECSAALKNMARVLKSMCDNPYLAQNYVQDYFTNFSTVSSWLYSMKDMPLSLDEIQITPFDSAFENTSTTFLQSLKYALLRFMYSFTRDYQSVSVPGNDGKEITVWVGWGRDQAAVLNSLIRESFTEKTGIGVKLKIVSSSIVNGILSGNCPDLHLQISRSEPVNLGMRGALYDLTNFEDFDDTLERFQQGADIPYRYKDKCYALPDTQSYFVMFYRSDIFKDLGLDLPKTWDDFIRVSTAIQRNNMQVYVPYTQITTAYTVNQGIGNLNLFPTLISQNGLSLYNDDLTATAIATQESISVFDRWTKLYTDYRFVREADFYNRFRVGIMPLGIVPYEFYFQFSQMAPEIQGKWEIATIPGTVGGNNSVAGAGSGCVIIEQSKYHDESWEFLKWWTSAEIQERYSTSVESVLGLVGRNSSANVEAIKNLEWDRNKLPVLLKQWESVNEIPEVPGSYHLTRVVDQAFWTVLNGEKDALDAVPKWSKAADEEIDRKLKEYEH